MDQRQKQLFLIICSVQKIPIRIDKPPFAIVKIDFSTFTFLFLGPSFRYLCIYVWIHNTHNIAKRKYIIFAWRPIINVYYSRNVHIIYILENIYYNFVIFLRLRTTWRNTTRTRIHHTIYDFIYYIYKYTLQQIRYILYIYIMNYTITWHHARTASAAGIERGVSVRACARCVYVCVFLWFFFFRGGARARPCACVRNAPRAPFSHRSVAQ